MRNIKSIAMFTALALAGAASAVDTSATLSITNTSPDTLAAGKVDAFSWKFGDATTMSKTGPLNWTTPSSGESERTINISLQEGLPKGITSLKVAAATVATTDSGTAVTDPVVLTTANQPLINSIAAYSSGSTTLTYTVDVDAKGFTTDTAVVVNFTMTSNQ